MKYKYEQRKIAKGQEVDSQKKTAGKFPSVVFIYLFCMGGNNTKGEKNNDEDRSDEILNIVKELQSDADLRKKRAKNRKKQTQESPQPQQSPPIVVQPEIPTEVVEILKRIEDNTSRTIVS